MWTGFIRLRTGVQWQNNIKIGIKEQCIKIWAGTAQELRNNIKINTKETGREDVDRVHPALQCNPVTGACENDDKPARNSSN